MYVADVSDVGVRSFVPIRRITPEEESTATTLMMRRSLKNNKTRQVKSRRE